MKIEAVILLKFHMLLFPGFSSSVLNVVSCLWLEEVNVTQGSFQTRLMWFACSEAFEPCLLLS